LQLKRERKALMDKIANIETLNFDAVSYEVFEYQLRYTKVYADFFAHFQLKSKPLFLPVGAFKLGPVFSEDVLPDAFFESSGTTSIVNARHYVKDMAWYLTNCQKGFEFRYGALQNYCILALLPHYTERQHSSLVAMVSHFIGLSSYTESGFYLYNHDALYAQLVKCKALGIPTLMFGVSFALLDFAEGYSMDFPQLQIMETGGMKGRRKEITRDDLHTQIASAFGTAHVHSEYGMTELMSQAYSTAQGLFYPSPTMRVTVTEISDPLSKEKYGKTGLINVTDLANLDSCAFIATEDIGKAYEDGSFTVEGRLDQSDIRGCNLMVGDL
jgi:hypothetical protein